MIFLGDVISNNFEEKINENIDDIEKDGFMVFSHDGKMTIQSRIHPWRNNHKGREMQKNALKELQKKIGGEYIETVFDPELIFDVSKVKSARCNKDPLLFVFDEYVEVHCKEKDDAIIVPMGLLPLFEKEFPSLSFKGENKEWEFIEYDGGYPCVCNGDTIFKVGDIIIKTKILNHGVIRWKIEIPSILSEIDLPTKVFEYAQGETYCCGGCD